MFADAEKNCTAENHEYQHALNEAIVKIFTHDRLFFPEHHGRAGRAMTCCGYRLYSELCKVFEEKYGKACGVMVKYLLTDKPSY